MSDLMQQGVTKDLQNNSKITNKEKRTKILPKTKKNDTINMPIVQLYKRSMY